LRAQARRLARHHRILALDLRGHGDTSRSPRRLYSLDDLIGDLHELVVQLSLNGRDWDGRTYTRPWTLCGRGTGAAVATAYAARYPGRVSALMLCDYDPEWRKDRLAFDRFQTATFGSELEAATTLNGLLALDGDAQRLGTALYARCEERSSDGQGGHVVFRMDPFFFIPDLSTHNAQTLLASASRHAHVRLVHLGRADDGRGSVAGIGSVSGVGQGALGAWGARRAKLLAEGLGTVETGGALDAEAISLGDRSLSLNDEEHRLSEHLLALAAHADADAARGARAKQLAAPAPAKIALGAMQPASVTLSEEVIALQALGEDVYAMGVLGRNDRASLKARLKELGYKSMRQRIKLEEQLIALPAKP
jgi:pimeloyl-ACP methyl ester carboxylesterase